MSTVTTRQKATSRKAATRKSPRAAARASTTKGTASRRFVAGSAFFGAGGYEGARTDRASTRNWRPRATSADSEIIPDLEGLRGRVRDLARNAPLVAGALNTHLTSIVGPGLVPHPRIDAKYLGLTAEQATEWQDTAARIWWAMAGSTALDITRRSTFAHLTWILLRSWFTGGDVFYRRRYKARPGEVLALKVQLIEGDLVSNEMEKADTDTLIEGVELDEDREPVAFWVADRYRDDPLKLGNRKWSRQPAFGPATGTALMRQVALFERPNQTRGVSLLAPIIESIKQLTRYASAELDTTIAASFIMAVLITEAGDELGSQGTGSGEPDVGFAGGPGTAAADRQIELAPAAVPNLRPGEKLEAFNPQRPTSSFEPFFRVFSSIVGVAVDLPHELLIKHFQSSYSASRGAILEAWRGFTTKRSLIVIDQWAQPVYEWLITEAVARGHLKAPRFFSDPLIRAAYCECSWTGPIMGQLNPLDEANASKVRLDIGTTTLEEEIARETGGDDWERKHVQRAKEHKMRVAAGLEPAVLGATIASVASNPSTASTANERDADAEKTGTEDTPATTTETTKEARRGK